MVKNIRQLKVNNGTAFFTTLPYGQTVVLGHAQPLMTGVYQGTWEEKDVDEANHDNGNIMFSFLSLRPYSAH